MNDGFVIILLKCCGRTFHKAPFWFQRSWEIYDICCLCRHSLAGCCFLVKNVSKLSSLYKAGTNSSTFMLSHVMQMHPRSYKVAAGECVWSPCNTLLWHGSNMVGCGDALSKWARARYMSNTSIELKPDSDVVRFNIGEPPGKTGTSKKGKKKMRRVKMSRKAKLNELRFYRLKAKKKMTSPNPEVRIRYKLEKVCCLLSLSIAF